ncbi:hypothetical protein ACXET9_08130 [Brachybacterium sp. DNPG3]
MEPLRQELFTALHDRDDAKIEKLLASLALVSAADADAEHTLIAWARRLLESPSPLAATRVDTDEWFEYRDALNRALTARDLVGLSELLHQLSATHAVKHSTATLT